MYVFHNHLKYIWLQNNILVIMSKTLHGHKKINGTRPSCNIDWRTITLRWSIIWIKSSLYQTLSSNIQIVACHPMQCIVVVGIKCVNISPCVNESLSAELTSLGHSTDVKWSSPTCGDFIFQLIKVL